MTTPSASPALLALSDGTLWPGYACGALGETTGEVVFNTGLTGYQEILTDPSYQGQIIVMTQPHIGNYGVTPADEESARIWCAGLAVRTMSPCVDNPRAHGSLPDYLATHTIPGITDVDTRALVRHLRDHGAMNGALSSTDPDPVRLVARARAAPDMNGLDLVRAVTCAAPYTWPTTPGARATPLRVLAYDYGIKRNILRLLAAHGCETTVIPADTPADAVLAQHPDGVFLSNGPGDPAAVTYAITAVRALLGRVPIFGICLGHQILALALGATTYKLPFGHRGSNQPVRHTRSRTVAISSHNHGFAVRAESLPADVTVSHVNLNDGCVEGLSAPTHRAFSVQYHPEAAPGPHDAHSLFADFIALMDASR